MKEFIVRVKNVLVRQEEERILFVAPSASGLTFVIYCRDEVNYARGIRYTVTSSHSFPNRVFSRAGAVPSSDDQTTQFTLRKAP